MPAPLPRVLDIPVYGASRPSGAIRHRLSSNENPFPPPAAVLEAARAALEAPNRYPPLRPDALIAALAARLGVDPARVLPSPGSLAGIEAVLRSFVDVGDGVVYAWRSYEAYPVVLRGLGARLQPVPLRGHAHDLEAMLAAIDEGTRAVVVCNPNNPTGTVVGADELAAFLDAVPSRCLVILDEAYREFVALGAVLDGIEAAARWPNVVAVRTFSKAYGLAGLRLGYLVADAAVVDAAQRLLPPFAVTAATAAAGVAALASKREIDHQVDEIVRARDALVCGLRGAGELVPDSEANFVWLDRGADSRRLADRLAEAGFGVRCFAGEGVRISVGTRDALTELLEHFPMIRTI